MIEREREKEIDSLPLARALQLVYRREGDVVGHGEGERGRGKGERWRGGLQDRRRERREGRRKREKEQQRRDRERERAFQNSR